MALPTRSAVGETSISVHPGAAAASAGSASAPSAAAAAAPGWTEIEVSPTAERVGSAIEIGRAHV